MTFTISKRGLVRIISFSLAALLVLILLAAGFRRDSLQNQRALEYHYLQSIADLTTYVQNINTGLTKAMYANTPSMLSFLSNKIWREAGFAKNSLDALPVEYLNLQNTNKFLSQVGDYSVSIARSFEKGEKITEEQRENLKQMKAYCDKMLSEVIALNDEVETGSISFASVRGNISQEFDQGDDLPAPTIAEGFSEFEEGFSAYPTLIYDGPFSDHIMERESSLLKRETGVSRAVAKQKAAKVTGLPEEKFSDAGDEEGKMPSYGFSAEGVDVSVTKQGGLLCYLLKSRAPESRTLSVKNAITAAKEYLDEFDIPEIKPTYYEISGNVMIINFACVENNAVIYPDLIKVGVAMDNGEILSFDSRGYLMNHVERTNLTPRISVEEAKQSVSPLLTIEKSQLTLIPSEGLNELLCWEFLCEGENEQEVLVYINSDTGMEEQILILMIDENGQLTI